MANTLTLNCLVIPSAEPESVTRHSITTLKISTNETVDQLRPMIKERWPLLFENILPTNFILRKIDTGVVIQLDLYNCTLYNCTPLGTICKVFIIVHLERVCIYRGKIIRGHISLGPS